MRFFSLCLISPLGPSCSYSKYLERRVFFFSFGVGVEFVVKSLAFHLASLGSIPVPATVSLV